MLVAAKRTNIGRLFLFDDDDAAAAAEYGRWKRKVFDFAVFNCITQLSLFVSIFPYNMLHHHTDTCGVHTIVKTIIPPTPFLLPVTRIIMFNSILFDTLRISDMVCVCVTNMRVWGLEGWFSPLRSEEKCNRDVFLGHCISSQLADKDDTSQTIKRKNLDSYKWFWKNAFMKH